MLTPRPYISYSQMTTFETGEERYAEKYLRGGREFASESIAYGKMLADSLESGEASGDPALDLVAAMLPKLDRMDEPVECGDGEDVFDPHAGRSYCVPVLMDGKASIPILAKPDTAAADYSAFKEYKTSKRPWTQRRVDESGQITFYAAAIWIATERLPDDIELVNAIVEEDGLGLSPTGEILRFPTRRTLVDVLKMTARIKKAWAGIEKLTGREML